MQLALYADGRRLSYDEATQQFTIGDSIVTAEQVRAYDAAGQLAWGTQQLRTWFHQYFSTQAAAAPMMQAPPRKRRTGLVVGLVALGLLAVCGSLVAIGSGGETASPAGGDKASTRTATPASNSGGAGDNKPQPKVGQTFKTDNVEVTITSVETKTSVGGEFVQSKPAEGGIYVAVKWKYKNTTDKPIGVFGKPRLKLVDSSGTEYTADMGASSSYASELKLTEKVVSDLNPGITVTAADVFEVSKSSFDKSKWSLVVKDGEPVNVPLE